MTDRQKDKRKGWGEARPHVSQKYFKGKKENKEIIWGREKVLYLIRF